MCPVKDRSNKILKEMKHLILEESFFKKLDVTTYMDLLVNEIELFEYKENTALFIEGDEPNYIYIVMTGIVEVFIKRSSTNNPELIINDVHKNHGEFVITKINSKNTKSSAKNSGKSEKSLFRIENVTVDDKYILKKTLKVGEAFGEKRFFKKKTRNTIAIAGDQNTEIIQISKKSLEKVFREYRMQNLNMIWPCLRECSFFKGVTNETLEKLLLSTKIKTYNTNTLVCKQGHRLKYIHILKKGTIKVLRKVKTSILTNHNELIQSYKKEHSEMPDNLILDVDNIFEGATIGDYEFFNDVPLQNSFLTSMPVEMITIKKGDITTNFSNEELVLTRFNIKTLPENNKLV